MSIRKAIPKTFGGLAVTNSSYVANYVKVSIEGSGILHSILSLTSGNVLIEVLLDGVKVMPSNGGYIQSIGKMCVYPLMMPFNESLEVKGYDINFAKDYSVVYSVD